MSVKQLSHLWWHGYCRRRYLLYLLFIRILFYILSSLFSLKYSTYLLSLRPCLKFTPSGTSYNFPVISALALNVFQMAQKKVQALKFLRISQSLSVTDDTVFEYYIRQYILSQKHVNLYDVSAVYIMLSVLFYCLSQYWRFILLLLLLLLLLLFSLVAGLFFLVLLLNQRWSPPLSLQASHCNTFRIMCVMFQV